jgi:hypothetical protein
MEAPVITRFTFAPGKQAKLNIRVEGDAEGVIPQGRTYELRFVGFRAADAVSVTGGKLLQQHYCEEKKELVLLVEQQSGDVTVQLELPEKNIAEVDYTPAVYHLLNRAQLPYNMKETVFNTINGEKNPARLLGILNAMQLPDALIDALTEQITAGI